MLAFQGRGGEQGMKGELAALAVVLLACLDVHACTVRVA